MSNATLTKQWNEANQFLLTQLEYETTKDPTMVPKDRESAFQHLAVLYIKYIQAFRKLEVCVKMKPRNFTYTMLLSERAIISECI